jgi:hypothetical protein
MTCLQYVSWECFISLVRVVESCGRYYNAEGVRFLLSLTSLPCLSSSPEVEHTVPHIRQIQHPSQPDVTDHNMSPKLPYESQAMILEEVRKASPIDYMTLRQTSRAMRSMCQLHQDEVVVLNNQEAAHNFIVKANIAAWRESTTRSTPSLFSGVRGLVVKGSEAMIVVALHYSLGRDVLPGLEQLVFQSNFRQGENQKRVAASTECSVHQSSTDGWLLEFERKWMINNGKSRKLKCLSTSSASQSSDSATPLDQARMSDTNTCEASRKG